MRSCIYAGHIRHIRHLPMKNGFRYRMYMMYLDLDEIDHVFAERWFWSAKGFNLAFLRRQDHFGDPAVSIADSVRNLVEEKTGSRPAGPISMLSHLRYFGHCFNPATFFYCYDASGERLEYVIVEVHNTPWGEVFCYVLDESMNQGSEQRKKYTLQKIFHVSPFLPMDIEYTWSFSRPNEKIHVHMVDVHKDEQMFEAELDLERFDITSLALAKVLLLYPFMTVKVTLGIYWQALRLWVKGAKYYSHP
jgi:DUF1365 family protein